MGVAITIAALVVSTVTLLAAPSLEGTARAAADARPASVAEVQRELTAAADTRGAPRNLTPTLAEVDTDRPSYVHDQCHVDLVESELAPTRCVYGDHTSDTSIVIMGDSHMAQWFPALDVIARRRGWALIPMTKSSCPAADVIVINSQQRRYVGCEEYREGAIARIQELEPALLVMSSAASYGPAAEPDVWEPGYVSTIEQVRDAVETVLILGDTPAPRQDVPLCVSDHLADVRPCVQDRAAMVAPDHRDAEARAARATGAVFIDPTRWACAVRCPVIAGRILVWRDTNHLSTPYVRWLTEVVERAMEGVV